MLGCGEPLSGKEWDEDIRHLNINVRFTTVQRAVSGDGVVCAVDQLGRRVSTLRHFGIDILPVQIEIGLGEVVTLLIQSQTISGMRLAGRQRDAVQGTNTRGSHVIAATRQIRGTGLILFGMMMTAQFLRNKVRDARNLSMAVPLLLLDRALHCLGHLDTGSNVINVLGNVLGQVISIIFVSRSAVRARMHVH